MNIQKYYSLAKHLTIALDILFLIIISINYVGNMPDFWNIQYIFFFILAINTLFLTLKINEISESEREYNSIVYLSKYLFLLLLIVIAVNQFIKDPIIIKILPYLTALAISTGFLTFYSNKDKVEREMEDEKRDEEEDEHKRYLQFHYKFPTLNKIPVLRRIVRWMYKEGWAFAIPFIIIAIIFIAIKIAMPIIYHTTFMDENIHIFTGMNLFNNGGFSKIFPEIYTKGIYVTFLASLFISIFGKSLFIIKLTPILLGIVNFFLLYLISKKVLNKKRDILLILILYTFIPWFIFNHFYLRMYVFYEFFMLILTLLFLLIIDNIKNNKGIFFYSLITFVSILSLYISGDESGKYMILFYSFLFLSYIYFFQIQKIHIKNKLYVSFNKNYILKIILFLIILFLLLVYFKGSSLVEYFIFGEVTYTSGVNFKYNNLFFNENIFFTILFLCSFTFLFFKGFKESNKILIIATLIIFLIHYNSSLDLQMTRVIIYFLPLFYLVSIISLSKLFYIKNSKIIVVIIILLLMLNIYANYPKDFIKEPYIPSEVRGIPNKIYYDTMDLCKDHIIITSSIPWWEKFYNLNIQYYLNTWYSYDKINITNEEMSFVYFDQIEKRFKDRYTNIPLIINVEELQRIISEGNFCYISGGVPSNWVNSETQKFISDNFKLEKTYGLSEGEIEMKLYIEKNENTIHL